jgi:uncharacterized membrane protein YgcG
MIETMREHLIIFLILVVIACIFSAGCVQSSGNSTETAAVLQANVSLPDPATPVLATIATSAPYEVVTVIRYVSPPREVKDSYLLFSLEVPGEWNVSTTRMMKSDTSDYRTELVAGNVFSIYSYYITPSREQDYRDRFRQWIPAPVEKAVTINTIRYDRYESRVGGNTTVAYLARANSANEHGYGSVLVFTARDCNRFELEDFENVVSSFRYFSAKSAGTLPGDEIPVYDVSGKAVYRRLDPRLFNSTDGGGDGDMSSSDSGTSGGDSSGGDSSGGGGCNSGSWSWE